MTRVPIIVLAAWCASATMSGVAFADDEEPEAKPKEGDADAPKDTKGDEAPPAGDVAATGKTVARMTMPGGKILLNAIVESNLAKGAAGKPFSIAPDIWYGVSDKLTLGLVHSGRGQTGFLTGAGRGLCFGDKEGVCALGLGKIYTSVGAEARIGLTEGGFPIALAIGGIVEAFKPDLVASSKVGFIGRLQSSRIAIEIAPTVFAGLTQRKVEGVSINEDVFSMPVTLLLQLSPSFALALQSGVTLTIENAGDSYVVPAAAGLAVWITPKLSFDVAFGLAAVVDKDDMKKAFDDRSLTIGVGYGM
ncbi:MAG: hypothetical protein ABI867_03040 [Kofleriaceae bacterium]